jgi:hypothetical protein
VATPISVNGGVLEGFDGQARKARRYPLHRINTVALVERRA